MDGVTPPTGKSDLGIDDLTEALALVNELDCMALFPMTMEGVWDCIQQSAVEVGSSREHSGAEATTKAGAKKQIRREATT